MPISVPSDTPLTLNSNPTSITTGSRVTETVTLTNNSAYPLNNITLRVNPSGGTFVEGSARINGMPQTTTDNPINGIPVETLGAGDTLTLTYDLETNNPPTTINDVAVASFSATDENNTQNYTVTSNIATIPLENTPTNQTIITKSVNRNVASTGDILTYTITIQNGDTPLTGLTFQDSLPNGLTYVINSLTINGVIQPSINPSNRFALNNLPANSVTTITYQTRANIRGTMQNFATIEANELTSPITSNIVITTIQNRQINCCYKPCRNRCPFFWF